MAVNVEFGVSGVAAFRAGVKEAEQSIKTLDAELKLNEKQLKVSGDAEQYLTNKTKLLEKQIKEQTNVVKQAETALKNMKRTGVDENSAAFQKMQEEVYKAQGKLADMQAELMNVNSSMQQTASGADKLTESVNGINRKISLDQVITGIGSITSGLEKAAKKAVDLGETIWTSIMDSARWADDTATMATIMDMSVEDYQRYQKVFDTIGDITVQEWHKMKRKVEKAIQDPTEDQNQLFDLLGISTHEMHAGKYGPIAGMAKDYEDLFWEVSRELQKRVKNGSMTQASANVYAEALFGKGFDQLKPLTDLGEEAFKEAFENQRVNSEEAVKNMAELNDKVIKLQGDFQTLKTEVLGDIAPALTKGAELLDSLLGKMMDYLETEEGQKALEDMGKAVEGLFTDLSNIDPEQVVEGFAGVFNGIVGGLQWLEENSGGVITALETIVAGWAALKLTGGALQIVNLINGISGLGGGAAAASQAGAAAGASWGAGFANAVAAAAPWLIGMYALLNPAETGNNDLADANGKLTQEGWEDFRWQRERAMNGETQDNVWWDLIQKASGIVENGDKLWFDEAGIQALAQFANSGDADKLASELAALGYVLRDLTEAPDQTPEGQVYVDSHGGLIHKDRRTGKPIQTISPADAGDHFVVEDVDIEAILNAKEGKEQIEEQVGVVDIPVRFTFGGGGVGGGAGGSGGYQFDFLSMMGIGSFFSHANGLFDVPWDGYPAILHKHERVVPAREIGSSRNFSSNLYVESMIMNNGTDAAGLAAAMAAAQRRTMSGFGS